MQLSPAQTTIFILACILPGLIISLIVTALVRRFALPLGLVDKPGERKVHVTPTPLGGGIGIWFGMISPFLAGTLIVLLFDQVELFQQLVPTFAKPHIDGLISKLDSLWLLLGAGTVLMLVGLADDKWQIGWKPRLGLQFLVAAICVIWQGWRLTAFINIPLLTGLLSVIWIVAMINSFNMLDNMDCLSGGVAAIAASVLGAVMLLSNEPGNAAPQIFVAGFLFVLAGSISGFLFHNRPPAKIFMGDAGSYFVGFCIAVATLLATYSGYNSSSQHGILAPLFVMAVPMYDMTSVLIIRVREGRSPFQADKSHISHRLVDLGFSKTQAVLTIYLLSGTCGLAAIMLHRVDWIGGIILTLMVLSVLALIAIIETTARRKLNSSD